MTKCKCKCFNTRQQYTWWLVERGFIINDLLPQLIKERIHLKQLTKFTVRKPHHDLQSCRMTHMVKETVKTQDFS